ncbi:MAG TPA: PKD domain-containing protein [Thermoleophilaceae bacterium]|jgi:prepilin-type N-terminal cleavage/methylation domain-containing protein
MILRGEDGFTLLEVMIGLALTLVILGAALTAFTGFEGSTRSNALQNDALERNRAAIDQLARDLRNGTTPSPQQPNAIEKAAPFDLVTQTVHDVRPTVSANNRNVRRVRYCLDDSNPQNGKLWLQTQNWSTFIPPAVPSTTACPSSAWDSQQVVADRVVNRRNGGERPVWTFNSTNLDFITRIKMELWVDVNSAADRPKETRLSSAVFMRNQNETPSAQFTATLTGYGHVLLNATASSDPEGERLSYRWYDGSTPISQSGIAVDYAPRTSGSHTITLNVFDPSGLFETASQVVVVP